MLDNGNPFHFSRVFYLISFFSYVRSSNSGNNKSNSSWLRAEDLKHFKMFKATDSPRQSVCCGSERKRNLVESESEMESLVCLFRPVHACSPFNPSVTATTTTIWKLYEIIEALTVLSQSTAVMCCVVCSPFHSASIYRINENVFDLLFKTIYYTNHGWNVPSNSFNEHTHTDIDPKNVEPIDQTWNVRAPHLLFHPKLQCISFHSVCVWILRLVRLVFFGESAFNRLFVLGPTDD